MCLVVLVPIATAAGSLIAATTGFSIHRNHELYTGEFSALTFVIESEIFCSWKNLACSDILCPQLIFTISSTGEGTYATVFKVRYHIFLLKFI